MTTDDVRGFARFQDLVFSDLQRYRPGEGSWPKVLFRCLTLPGMVASIFLRAMQVLGEHGHRRVANVLRTPALVLTGADFVPGMRVGRGLLLAHPVGVTFGAGTVIGDNVSFAAGVTCAARYAIANVPNEFPTIGDGAVLGAHAVVVGGVKVGDHAMVGANSVVLSDVPDYAVVIGNPARRVGTREDVTPPSANDVETVGQETPGG